MLRETGPVVLVPAAWAVAAASLAGALTDRTLLIAHAVMTVSLAAFAVSSWSEMSDGVLRVWRAVLVAGIPVTLAGLAALFGAAPEPLAAVSLYGWVLLPAVGLAYTAREVRSPVAYAAGALLCAVGASALALSQAAGVGVLAPVGALVVGAGQTAGIADAVHRY